MSKLRALQRNQAIPHKPVLAEFGLTMDDWEKMAAAADSSFGLYVEQFTALNVL